MAMRPTYAVVIEEAEGNFSAHVPDLPGCVATGATRDAVLDEIRSAIAFHLEGMAADAARPPAPRTSVATVTI
jgi:predicted RNase H-like HicB family nuclease